MEHWFRSPSSPSWGPASSSSLDLRNLSVPVHWVLVVLSLLTVCPFLCTLRVRTFPTQSGWYFPVSISVCVHYRYPFLSLYFANGTFSCAFGVYFMLVLLVVLYFSIVLFQTEHSTCPFWACVLFGCPFHVYFLGPVHLRIPSGCAYIIAVLFLCILFCVLSGCAYISCWTFCSYFCVGTFAVLSRQYFRECTSAHTFRRCTFSLVLFGHTYPFCVRILFLYILYKILYFLVCVHLHVYIVYILCIVFFCSCAHTFCVLFRCTFLYFSTPYFSYVLFVLSVVSFFCSFYTFLCVFSLYFFFLWELFLILLGCLLLSERIPMVYWLYTLGYLLLSEDIDPFRFRWGTFWYQSVFVPLFL